MGQTSSQVAATQGQDFLRGEDAMSNVSGSSPRITMSAPRPKKRVPSPESSNDASTHKSKRVKMNDQPTQRKKIRAGRSMPQHCRGTAILPRQGTAMPRPHASREQMRDMQSTTTTLLEQRPQTSSTSSDEFYDASSIMLIEEAAKKKDKVEAATNEQFAIAKARTKQTHKEEDIMQEVKVNPIGQPGPRKRKRSKRDLDIRDSNHEDHREEVLSTQHAVQQNTATQRFIGAQLAVENAPIASAGVADMSARRAKDIPPSVQQKETNKIQPLPVTASREKADEDVRVSAIGKPGPRKKKRVPGSQYVDESEARVEGHDVEVNPVGQPGPMRKKKQKQQHAIDTSVKMNNPKDSSQHADPPKPAIPFVPPEPADHIPTPPTSAEEGDQPNEKNDHPILDAAADNDDDDANEHDVEYDSRVREGYVDPANKISAWLHNGDSPAPPDQLPPSLGSPKQSKRKRTESSRKQEQPSAIRADDDDGYQDDQAHSDGESVVEDKPKPNSQRRKSNKPEGSTSQPGQQKRGTVTGKWSVEEKALAERIFQDALKHYEISVQELGYMILDFKEQLPITFKELIYGAFPLRAKKSIREYFRRKFPNWKTGPWTPEEDKQLKSLYYQYQGQDSPCFWAEVGSSMCRLPDACRDRWNEVISLEGVKNSGPWTREEEDKLRVCVESCIKMLQDRANEEGKDGEVKTMEEWEAKLDWKQVEEVMEGRRSAKRCKEKWRSLKLRAEAGDATIPQANTTAQRQANDQGQLSRKQKALESAYAKIGWGDVYDALDETCKVLSEDDERRVYEHESTFWSIVSTRINNEDPTSKFRPTPKLRRRSYYGALEMVGPGPHNAGATTLAKEARRLRAAIEKMGNQGQLVLQRKMQTKAEKEASKESTNEAAMELSKEGRSDGGQGRRNAAPRRASRERAAPVKARANSSTNSGTKHLSAEFIDNSDDESAPAPTFPASKTRERDHEVPQAQDTQEDVVTGAERDEDDDMETVDDVPMSSLNSRFDAVSLWSATPRLTQGDFMQRCRGARVGGARIR